MHTQQTDREAALDSMVHGVTNKNYNMQSLICMQSIIYMHACISHSFLLSVFLSILTR